jgi:hypothetical protein
MTPAKPAFAPKTALVLAGGGSLGAVQVGMLRALLESGVEPDMVVGSSVGSINGAYFAGDPTLDGIAKLERLWCGLKRRDIFPWTWRRPLRFHSRAWPSRDLRRPEASARQPSSLSRPEGRGRASTHRRVRRSLGQSCGAFAGPGDASHPRQHGDPGRLRAGRDRRAAAVRRSRRQQYAGDRCDLARSAQADCPADGFCLCPGAASEWRYSKCAARHHATDREPARGGAGTGQAADAISHSPNRLPARRVAVRFRANPRAHRSGPPEDIGLDFRGRARQQRHPGCASPALAYRANGISTRPRWDGGGPFRTIGIRISLQQDSRCSFAQACRVSSAVTSVSPPERRAAECATRPSPARAPQRRRASA